MKATKLIFAVNGGLLLVAAGVWLWPRGDDEMLRRELVALRREQREVERMRAENQRLAMTLGSAGEVERFQSDRAALERLKAELAQLKQPAEKKAVSAVTEKRMATDPKAPAGAGPVMPAGEWKNAGRVTPAATLETLMWAAAGGDVDALAAACWVPPSAIAAVKVWLDGLTDEARANYGSPERLVAMLTSSHVPLGAMQVIKEEISPASGSSPNMETALLRVRLKSTDGRWEDKGLMLYRNTSTQEGWRFSVPASAVEEYLAMLKAPVTAAANETGRK